MVRIFTSLTVSQDVLGNTEKLTFCKGVGVCPNFQCSLLCNMVDFNLSHDSLNVELSEVCRSTSLYGLTPRKQQKCRQPPEQRK